MLCRLQSRDGRRGRREVDYCARKTQKGLRMASQRPGCKGKAKGKAKGAGVGVGACLLADGSQWCTRSCVCVRGVERHATF